MALPKIVLRGRKIILLSGFKDEPGTEAPSIAGPG